MRNPLWAAVWPWVIFGCGVVFGSSSLQDYRAGGVAAGTESMVALIELAAMFAAAAWGFRRIVSRSRDRRARLFQVLCFVIAVPALAWSDPNTHTLIFVGVATLGVALAKLTLAHQETNQNS